MIKWSNLRGISQSKAAGLTVLIPLIGLFIFFNEFFVKYLQLSTNFLHDIGEKAQGAQQPTGASIDGASLNRLYLLYFGLCSVGIGTFIFRSLCPWQVKQFESPKAFYEAESKLPPWDRLRDALFIVTQNRVAAKGRFYIMTSGRSLLRNRFDQMFESTINSNTVSSVYLDGGKLDARYFSDAWMFNNLSPRFQASHNEVKTREVSYELLTSEYLIADRYYFLMRILVAFLLYFGFILLFIPTAQAFYKISMKLYQRRDEIIPFLMS